MPTIVISGASQGIGEAIARAFAEQEDGVRLVLLARSADKLGAVATICRAKGAEVLVLPCDVSEPEQVATCASQVLDDWGPPDVLVNNAGQFVPGSVEASPVDEFRYQVDVNLNSAFYLTRSFLGPMKARGTGTIFFMASVASVRAYAGAASYTAAKHGLLGLARAVRQETIGSGVRSTAIILGATYTPSWEGSDLPPDRFIPPEDVADTVVGIYRAADQTVFEEILIRPAAGDI